MLDLAEIVIYVIFLTPFVLLFGLPLVVGIWYILKSGFFKKAGERKYPRYPVIFLILPLVVFALYAVFVNHFSRLECAKLGFWLNYHSTTGSGVIWGMGCLLFLLLIIIPLILARRHEGPPRKIFITAIIIVFPISVCVVMLLFMSLNTARVLSRDSERVVDLRQIGTALGMYYNDYHTYPEVNSWISLGQVLVPHYMPILPVDPDKNRQYGYGVSPDGQKFILKASLDKCFDARLGDDRDGLIYGIDCGDPQKRYSENQYCTGN